MAYENIEDLSGAQPPARNTLRVVGASVADMPDAVTELNMGRVDVRGFGATDSERTTTGSTSDERLVVNDTIDSIDFKVGQGVVIYGAGDPHGLTVPGAPTVTPVQPPGAPPGSTTYAYRIVAVNGSGGYAPASEAGSTTTGPATRSATSHLLVSIAPVPDATAYHVYVQVGGEGDFHFAGKVAALSTPLVLEDRGEPAAVPEGMPATAPEEGQNNFHRAKILGIEIGAGTVELRLSDPAPTAASALLVVHDNVQAIQDALAYVAGAGASEVFFPGGPYRIVTGRAPADPAWATAPRGAWLFAITRDGTRLTGNNTTIRHIAHYCPQATGANADPPSISYTLWRYRGPRENVTDVTVEGLRFECIEGQWARLGGLSWNYMFCHLGFAVRRRMTNCQFAGYPSGGSDLGVDPGGDAKFSHNIFENIFVDDFGGGGHDAFWYMQGGTRWTGGKLRAGRPWHSHGFYFGLDRPDMRFEGTTFEQFDRGQIIAWRGTEEDEVARDIYLVGCHFNDTRDGQIVLGYTTGARYMRAHLVGCTFERSDLRCYRVDGLEISGCHFDAESVIHIVGCHGFSITGGTIACQLRIGAVVVSDVILRESSNGVVAGVAFWGDGRTTLDRCEGVSVNGSVFDEQLGSGALTEFVLIGTGTRRITVRDNVMIRRTSGRRFVYVGGEGEHVVANNDLRLEFAGGVERPSITVDRCAHVLLKGNTIRDKRGGGNVNHIIQISLADNVYVRDNEAFTSSTGPISFYDGAPAGSSNNYLNGNLVPPIP